MGSTSPALFVQQLVLAKNIESPHYWPFVRGSHRWSVDSPHKGPVMRKTFPCHGVVKTKVQSVPVFYLLLGISSDYARPITGQVTEVTCPVIGQAQPELTPSKRQKMGPGPRFNIKMTSYQYRKSHCGNKTIIRPSYLHNGISYTGKTTSLYWIGALVLW